jgi:diaminopropionate ammonia-lyase
MAAADISTGARYVLNPEARNSAPKRQLFALPDLTRAAQFHRAQPNYHPTPLVSLPAYARELGIRELLVKDESSRMGLNAFKITGVAYAIDRLRERGALPAASILACATDGNHGRAVARVAREMKLNAKVYMHKGAVTARVQAIRDEGAEVVIVDGNYDDAVRTVARDAQEHGWLVISDTSWPGYEQIPRDIMAGYTILMAEAAAQWSAMPDVVLIQAGVGGLAAAVLSWLLHEFGNKRPFVVCCEPDRAACVLESLRAGRLVELKGSLDTIMAGLSCGLVSSLAWPILKDALDACVAIRDAECAAAMRKLAHLSAGDPPLAAGESGACGIAALAAILREDEFRAVREDLHLNSNSRVFVINTEGVTDPESYRAITS